MVKGMDMDLFEVFIFELYNIFLVLLDVNGLFREVYVLNFVVLKIVIWIIFNLVY